MEVHAEKHTYLECTEHSDSQHPDLETNYHQHQINTPCYVFAEADCYPDF